MRLFIGTFLDSELVNKVPFEEIQKIFGDNLKPIKKGNIHMTWIFVGKVETIHELSLREIIDRHIDLFKGLVFQFHRLELWPPKKPPRLIVLSGKLNKQINLNPIIQDLKTVSSPDEKEDFIPHITVARFKKDKTVRAGFSTEGGPASMPKAGRPLATGGKPVPALPLIERFNWQIKELSLVQSILTSEGPKYEKVKNWEL